MKYNYITRFMVSTENALEVEEVAQAFAAMGSEARLEVVLTLVRAGADGLSIGEIQTRTGMPASTLAHHLKFLASAGLIEQEKQGRCVVNRPASPGSKPLPATSSTNAAPMSGARRETDMSDTLQTAPRRIDWKGWLWTPWTLVVLLPLAVLALDPANFQTITVFAASAFARVLPYIAFAVILIAWLKAAGAESTIGNAFKGRETHMILLAAVFGGLAPFCSCQVIPFIAGLLAVGVPLAPVMAFWLSSPLIDPPTLLITAGALGWTFAIAKAVAAVSLGLMGGFAVKAMMANGAFADPLRPRSGGGCCKKKTRWTASRSGASGARPSAATPSAPSLLATRCSSRSGWRWPTCSRRCW